MHKNEYSKEFILSGKFNAGTGKIRYRYAKNKMCTKNCSGSLYGRRVNRKS